MKTIGYLGQIDTLFGSSATTRSWNTILSVLRILKGHEASAKISAMLDEHLKAELERLKAENEALKKRRSNSVSMKVSEKGAVSIYRLGRFP